MRLAFDWFLSVFSLDFSWENESEMFYISDALKKIFP